MRESPDKIEIEVSRNFVDRLTNIERQLHPAHREDRFVRDPLIIGADISHIQNSLQDKIPATSQEAVNRIVLKLSDELKSARAYFVCAAEHRANYGLGRTIIVRIL